MSDTPIPVFRLPLNTTAQARLDALEQELTNAAGALDNGEVSSLTGVDVEVANLCEQVMQMTTGEAGPFVKRLQALSDAFTALGEVMSAQRDEVKGELSELQARQKAHRAYGMRDVVNAAASTTTDEQE